MPIPHRVPCRSVQVSHVLYSRKGSPLADVLDDTILRLQSNGLIGLWMRRDVRQRPNTRLVF